MLTNSDALSGGLPTGNQTVVSSAQNMNFGRPGTGAVKVATIVGDTSKIAIYRYDAGATLANGQQAQGRRIGFFLNDRTASANNTNGTKLFDAAIKWIVGL